MPKGVPKSKYQEEQEKEAAAAERRRSTRAVLEAQRELVYDVTLTHHEREMIIMKSERRPGAVADPAERRLVEKLRAVKGKKPPEEQQPRARKRGKRA